MTTRQQVMRFSLVGFVCTVLYMLSFWGLREAGVLSQVANFSAMSATIILSTNWNRRFTFGVSGRTDWWKHQGQALVMFMVGLAFTAATLGIIYHSSGQVDPRIEMLLATGANMLASCIRFFGLRGWVFSPKNRSPWGGK